MCTISSVRPNTKRTFKESRAEIEAVRSKSSAVRWLAFFCAAWLHSIRNGIKFILSHGKGIISDVMRKRLSLQREYYNIDGSVCRV